LCIQDGETSVTLDAGPGTDFTYAWRRSGSTAVIGTTRTITVNNLGVYTIAISNGGSCVVNDTIRVVDKCEPRIFIPEAFTPNADGINSVLEVKGKHVGQVEMLIYNRWGELIFSNKGGNLDELSTRFWDGTYLGKPAPTGTYVWKITYRSLYYPDRDPITLRGGVLLMR
jgi:gliding motility-associated-like protein